MQSYLKKINTLFMALIAVLALTSQAWAEFPDRRIQIINPWAPGDSEDIVMRKAAEHMAKELGVPVKVVNRPGGGGIVGGTAMVNARPDGYTIGILTQGPAITHPLMGNSPYTMDDYDTIGLYLDYPFALAVRADAPYNTVKELADYVKQGNQVTLGTFAKMSVPSLVSNMIAEQEGFDFARIVALDPVNTLVLANGDADVVTIPESNSVKQDSDTKALITLTNERVSPLPNTPNMKEAYNLDVTLWAGLFAPKGTPADAMEKLTTAFKNALKQPDIAEFAQSSGAKVYFMDAQETQARIAKEAKLFKSMIDKLAQ
ncbi:MAG: tripartite tricarboxylate transporter substrate binding protein [Oceanospirillales bacterium]|nr:tripartite tricarboxylate transporter substrate binding protein [Oceanospirillales bacterium]MBR9886668.1 tripartite tricarboxylate transporter substrate binding protein [Oceanospirillales bacterium]